MLRRNIHLIVPDDGIAADMGAQEKGQALQIGKDGLVQQRTRVIDASASVRKGQKQGVVRLGDDGLYDPRRPLFRGICVGDSVFDITGFLPPCVCGG